MIPTTLRVPISSANMALDCVRVTGGFFIGSDTVSVFLAIKKKNNLKKLIWKKTVIF